MNTFQSFRRIGRLSPGCPPLTLEGLCRSSGCMYITPPSMGVANDGASSQRRRSHVRRLGRNSVFCTQRICIHLPQVALFPSMARIRSTGGDLRDGAPGACCPPHYAALDSLRRGRKPCANDIIKAPTVAGFLASCVSGSFLVSAALLQYNGCFGPLRSRFISISATVYLGSGAGWERSARLFFWLSRGY